MSLVQPMPVPADKNFYIDPNRCIGCEACLHACAECDTHKGHSMIHLETVDRRVSPQTVPVICMHCDRPTCAEVCPADAIKRTEDGVVQSARKPRCIACNNCVLACPFGVPKMYSDFDLMMKCDMCYDRTSAGKKPMCATVCPSGALFYGAEQEIETLRPRSRPMNDFQFGRERVTTRVRMMVPASAPNDHLDVVDAMDGEGSKTSVELPILSADDMMFAGLYVSEESRADADGNAE
ncbi:MAG: 4Fe-4S dicluster domain-containing protein [Planctomycetaceae bacterium]